MSKASAQRRRRTSCVRCSELPDQVLGSPLKKLAFRVVNYAAGTALLLPFLVLLLPLLAFIWIGARLLHHAVHDGQEVPRDKEKWKSE